MSVKDQLEQSHIDGSHTTVKSKRSSTSTVLSAFNKEAAWKMEQYGKYEGEWIIVSFVRLSTANTASTKQILLTPEK
jgi:hypothetical protein